jgi:hypothetical protein
MDVPGRTAGNFSHDIHLKNLTQEPLDSDAVPHAQLNFGNMKKKYKKVRIHKH